MNQILRRIFALAATLVVIAATTASSQTSNGMPGDLAYPVKFDLGYSQFAPGDSITITSVRGSSSAITTNEIYCVEGAYTLASHDSAEISFFATVANSGPTPVEPKQTMRITKGSGKFKLVKTMSEQGYLHVSFYDGNSFGGVYFGQEPWVRHDKHWDHQVSATPNPAAGPNAAIYQYLGDPVPSPPDLDPAYSKRGLTDAVQKAAGGAGISVKSIEIDDSEFPFVIGAVCQDGDWPKLKGKLKQLDGYEFDGSIGNDTVNTFNIVPWRKFPQDAAERINRRMGVRELMLYDRLTAR